jgi:peptidoglycan/LPS O-acetylase OafA/YrhL
VQYSISYRRDIDGLRAAAVLSVLFYHAHIPGFGGGFSGVDVFFVISGFLIGGHIGDEIGAGRFSLLAFYERRIRRILPALFFMYAVVLLATRTILFPPDLARFTKVGLFVIPFLANFRIFKTLGEYSGAYAQDSPLLHTWSLAVEEQFYLLFPLVMLAISRFAGRKQ